MIVSPEELFRIIDAVDTERFRAICTENPTFRFGNAEPSVGYAAVAATQRGFAESVADMRHEVLKSWEHDDALIVEGKVTFTRHDGTSLTVPFADIFSLEGGKVRDTHIYMDASGLFPAG